MNKKDCEVRYLSGGMKRRLSIAISSIGDPQIILYDEPTNGLDPLKKNAILELLKKLKKDKIIILTTHLMEEADELSDRILILQNGKVSVIGTSFELKNEFSSDLSFFVILKQNEDGILFENFFSNFSNQIKISSMFENKIVLKILNNNFGEIVECMKYLNDPKNKFFEKIKDWGFDHLNLENVFFNLHRKNK